MLKNIILGALFLAFVVIAAQAVTMGEHALAAGFGALAVVCGIGIGGRKTGSPEEPRRTRR